MIGALFQHLDSVRTLISALHCALLDHLQWDAKSANTLSGYFITSLPRLSRLRVRSIQRRFIITWKTQALYYSDQLSII
jgi:hypothetical protein